MDRQTSQSEQLRGKILQFVKQKLKLRQVLSVFQNGSNFFLTNFEIFKYFFFFDHHVDTDPKKCSLQKLLTPHICSWFRHSSLIVGSIPCFKRVDFKLRVVTGTNKSILTIVNVKPFFSISCINPFSSTKGHHLLLPRTNCRHR